MNNVKLSKLRFINWHKCSDSGILDISGNTMFSGATGSGKSTAIDAIYSTLFVDNKHFNKAANSKSQRNLKGYVRCLVNELNEDNTINTYQRTGVVISYVLIEILSEKNQKNIIGVCHHSPNENAEVTSHYFVIGNCDIEKVEILNNNNVPIDWKTFKNKYEDNPKHKFIHTDLKQDARQIFARQLGFGAGGDKIYEKYGKAVSNAIAFRPDNMNNINTFFKHTLFKENIIDISSVKETCENYERLRQDVIREEEKVAMLSEIKALHDKMVVINNRQNKLNITSLIAKKHNIESELLKLEQDKEICEREIKKINEEETFLTKRRDELISEQARLNNSDITQNLKRMEDELAIKRKKLSEITDLYDNFTNAILSFNACVFDINNILNTKYDKVDIQSFFEKNCDENIFMELLDSIDSDLQTKIILNKQEHDKIETENITISAEIEKMEKGVLLQDENLLHALDVINNYYKANDVNEDAKCLYQCINIKPEYNNWQQSIESLLNKARFNIVVEPVHYNNITQLFKAHNIEGVSLIDTTALKEKYFTESPSICDMLIFENEYVEKYIQYRYGKVIPVASCINLSLDKNKMYIGEDGTHYATKVFNIPKTNTALFIGENARKQAIESRKEKIKLNKQTLTEIFNNDVKINKIKNRIKDIKKCCMKMEYSTFLCIQSLPEEIKRREQDILDFKESNNLFLIAQKEKEFQEKIDEIDIKLKQTKEKLNSESEKRGSLKSKITEHCETLQVANSNIQAVQGDETLYAEAETYYKELCNDKRKTPSSVLMFCVNEFKRNDTEFNDLDKILRPKQNEYMKNYNSSISCSGFDSIEAFEKEYNRVSSDSLIELRKQAEIAKIEQETQIKKHIFEQLKHSVKEARTSIRALNSILEKNPFGDNVYKIQIRGATDGYEEGLNIIEKYDQDPQGSLFSSSSGISEDDFDNFIAEIQNDPQKQDYRNYLNVDIQVTKKTGDASATYWLSNVITTNSGGETQIPFYVLCAIAILNVTNNKAVLENMIKINILDEAFDKMDNATIQNTMNFYSSLGFQTLLSAPDSKNEILSDIMDNRIVVLNKSIHRGFKNVKPRVMLEFSKIKS